VIAPIILSTIALALTGHPVEISCQSEITTGYSGNAFVGQPQMSLSKRVCNPRGKGIPTFVFLHELGHTTGIEDEHEADCYAQHHLRAVLRKFWHETKKRAQREYEDALEYNSQLPGYGCGR
jgi:hypothetical protein